MEIVHLEQLIAIEESGTLSKAAEKLFLSQPALSRSMQKLEQELGVELFTRQKNKIELSETGKFACEYARTILHDFNVLPAQIRAYDRSRKTICVGSCAPSPLWEILPFLSTHYPEKRLSSETKDTQTLVDGLLGEVYQMIITTEPIENPDVLSLVAGKETILLNVPKLHPLAKKKDGVTFAEIEKYSVLLYSQIGVWDEVVRKNMPNVHIILQEDWESFVALTRESALLSFNSDLAIKNYGRPDKVEILPILDESATLTYYCHILKKNKSQLRKFWELYQ